MVKIYCIEDINDLKYVGSTKLLLRQRLAGHKYRKNCSSNKLNLYNCIIYVLEECSEENRKEREKYWIQKIDCVNIHIPIVGMTREEYHKQYTKLNKDKKREYDKEYKKKLKSKKHLNQSGQ
mgnify:FL=1|tara:strand:+ start:90 stop:455 length:366 start_codon:yes stop_codon:yes gene_type:complete